MIMGERVIEKKGRMRNDPRWPKMIVYVKKKPFEIQNKIHSKPLQQRQHHAL